MSFEFVIMAKNIIIALLFALLVYALSRIRFLRRSLSEEGRKRLVPILILEKEENGGAFFVKNEGICSAKNISIEDFQLPLEYDFKRTVTIRFNSVGILNPGQRAKLYFDALDGGRKVGDHEMSYLLPKINEASFEVKISYTNLESVRYVTIIGKQKDRIFVRYAGSPDRVIDKGEL
ncbi:MAG: hypothetical protein KAR05_10140 [Candidatus Omnitrophica bacterium]|nr:hypothetical protein [Candidatus Omnitrophota bacterium]